jgi:hypothetical protein
MDALPPTLDAPPAIVRGTGLSRDMIGWHRCWQFRDHIPLGFLKGKVTQDLDHVNGKDFFRNLLDDNINIPGYEYGSLMYISDKKVGKNQEEDARRRVFIINKSRKYFFLNQYSMTNYLFASVISDGELRNALKKNIVSIKNDTKGEILKINNFLAPNDKIISLHKEIQNGLPYFRDYHSRPLFYPDTVEKMWRKENHDWPKAGVDIFDFIKKYDGLIMVELRADGYWMLGKKFLYVHTQGDWVSTATKEIYKKIKYVLAGNDEVSTASNDPVANTIISYLSIFSHFDLKILEKERSWVQRWQPIPIARCTVAFKPLVDDPAIPEHLKPIFPATPKGAREK